MYSACLVCRHARKGKGVCAGQALCFLSFRVRDIHDLCHDFERLSGVSSSFHDAESSGRFSSCSASTTATNSHSWEKSDVFTPATDSHKQEFRGEF